MTVTHFAGSTELGVHYYKLGEQWFERRPGELAEPIDRPGWDVLEDLFSSIGDDPNQSTLFSEDIVGTPGDGYFGPGTDETTS